MSYEVSSDPWVKALVWFRSSEGIWGLGVVSERKKEGKETLFSLELNENKKVIVKTFPVDEFEFEFQDVKHHDPSPETILKTVDMTALICLNEPEMIECLRVRYFNNYIYTSIGPLLIAINPFKQLLLYSDNNIKVYCEQGFSKKTTLDPLPPHIYQIGNLAYHRMFIGNNFTKRENQVIIVHGESGSGKTSSVKFILDYLAVVSQKRAELNQKYYQNERTKIGDQIVATNPIIESFGNAKTLRNNNSSRFGKFIELCFDVDGLISGAIIRSYLLETIRVTKSSLNERNFHIFYEIFTDSLISKQYDNYKFNTHILENFRYTNQSGEYSRYDNETDIDNYKRLRHAMSICNISTKTQEDIINIILALLHLGNIKFISTEEIGGEKIEFCKESYVDIQRVIELLEISEITLLHTFTTRGILIAGTNIEKKLNKNAALYAIDAFVQNTYHYLFQWIMDTINLTVAVPTVYRDILSYIGILDIFGFESFTSNSFEQLCINYTNEKLQNHFNYTIFHNEQKLYIDEGLEWSLVDYPDNTARLELLEHKVVGIFALCDEELKLPQPTDEKLAKLLYLKCVKNPYFYVDKLQQKASEFTIKHFARDVTYQCLGFLDKNRTNTVQEFSDCLKSSNKSLLQELSQVDCWESEEISSSTPTPTLSPSSSSASLTTAVSVSNTRNKFDLSKRATYDNASVSTKSTDNLLRASIEVGMLANKSMPFSKKLTTVSSIFSLQLYNLMKKIELAQPHFVRCIKPNDCLAPDKFEQTTVMQQLRSGGTLQAIQIFRAGFSTRVKKSDFLKRYMSVVTVCGQNFLSESLMDRTMRAIVYDTTYDWKICIMTLFDYLKVTLAILNFTDNINISMVIDSMNSFIIGKTLIFMRPHIYQFLESIRYFVDINSSKTIYHYMINFHRRLYSNRNKNVIKRVYPVIRGCRSYVLHKHAQFIGKLIATIKLQRRMKVFLARCFLVRAIRTSSRVAAIFRGYKVRLWFKQILYHSRQLRIQLVSAKIYRGFVVRQKYKKIRYAAITIQSVIRRAIIRNQFKIKLLAIICLQKNIKHWLMYRVHNFTSPIRRHILNRRKRISESSDDIMYWVPPTCSLPDDEDDMDYEYDDMDKSEVKGDEINSSINKEVSALFKLVREIRTDTYVPSKKQRSNGIRYNQNGSNDEINDGSLLSEIDNVKQKKNVTFTEKDHVKGSCMNSFISIFLCRSI